MKTKPERRDLNGIILLNKPGLLTSNAVLQQVKRLFQARKAGHMGSLDPLATGMLPICFGEATKFAHYGLEADKCYTVTAQFGITMSTGDAQGEILETKNADHLSQALLEPLLVAFSGPLLQTPPMYSALKHQGKKLYEFARAGIHIERPARPITIHQLELLSCEPPFAQFKVRCSKGTYIRTLIEDMGQRLGVGAHVVQLHRDYTAGFEEQPMYCIEALVAMPEQDRDHCLLAIDFMLQSLPIVRLSDYQMSMVFQGKAIELGITDNSSLFRLYNEANDFQGLAEWDLDSGLLSPKRLRATSTC